MEAAMAAITLDTAGRSGEVLARTAHARNGRFARGGFFLRGLHTMCDGLASMRTEQTEAERLHPQQSRDMRGPRTGRDDTAHEQFGPLDSNVLSEAIPAFFIGRNADGFWVARERNGLSGGIFLLESSALSFAHARAGDAGCATIFLSARFELDLENEGNALLDHIAPLLRTATRLRGRLGKLMEVVRLGSKDLRAS
jgi:hypothetical protein